MSLLLILIWLGYETYVSSESVSEAVAHSLIVLALVVAYEFCRLALLSKVPNALKSITLYPFGGLSNSDRSLTLEHTQSDAARRRSVRIACVPPLIFGAFAVLLALYNNSTPDNRILQLALAATATISVLLLLPVTPFPGGRFFTQLCKDSSQIPTTLPGPVKLLTLAAFVFLAVQSNSVTLTIVCIVYTGIALEQYLFERSRAVAERFTAGEAMLSRETVIVLQHSTSCKEALDKALQSFQSLFPVFQIDEPIGYVDKNSLLPIGDDGFGPLVKEVSIKTVSRVSPETPLSLVMSIFRESETPILFVFNDENECTGFLIKEKVLEFLVVRGSELQFDSAEDDDDTFS